MKEIETTIEVAASPAEVWDVLTDGAGHADWDPHIESITGTIAVDEKLAVKFRGSMTFKPVVTVASEGETFEWLGRLGMPGIFDGRHRWDLEATPTGTRITQSERFSGVLVPLMGKLLRKTISDFEASNEALAAQVVG